MSDLPPPIVVDANVAVKWVIDEQFTDEARALLQDSRRERRPLVGPPMLTSEVVSVIYQRLRSRDQDRHLSEDDAGRALDAYLAIPVQLVSPSDLCKAAFTFAREHGLSNTYDSLYVVLAQMLGVDMWTDDQQLLKALGGTAPWVRAIGDYSLTQR